MYAENLNFWGTSKSDPGKWIDAAKRQLKTTLGGAGRAAFMLAFEIKGDKFKIIWPTAATRSASPHLNESGLTRARQRSEHEMARCCVYNEETRESSDIEYVRSGVALDKAIETVRLYAKFHLSQEANRHQVRAWAAAEIIAALEAERDKTK